MRAVGFWLVEGSHRNMVKSSEPDANRSGRPPRAVSYLQAPHSPRQSMCLQITSALRSSSHAAHVAEHRAGLGSP